jgi:hypothetical protein
MARVHVSNRPTSVKIRECGMMQHGERKREMICILSFRLILHDLAQSTSDLLQERLVAPE